MTARMRPVARRDFSGTHLEDAALCAPTESCPACSSEAPRTVSYSIQAGPDVAFLKCPTCRGDSASRMPTGPTIESIYRGYYADGEEHHTFHEPRRLARHILQHARLTPRAGTFRILEVGGGDGTLARELAAMLLDSHADLRIEVAEIELYEGDDVQADDLSITFHRDIDEVDGRFDLVVANACLHQIPALSGLLSSMFRRVRAGGVFFASTAFVLPLARLTGGRVDTLFPMHVHDLGCSFWNAIVGTFELPARLTRSAPSMPETHLRSAPVRTLVSGLMKLPAHLELRVRGTGTNPCWKAVGGWEVFLEFDAESPR